MLVMLILPGFRTDCKKKSVFIRGIVKPVFYSYFFSSSFRYRRA